MKAKAVLFSLILATSLSFSLSAYDWGGTADNSTSLTYTGDDAWLQEDKLALWFATPIGQSIEFTMQASYTFTYEQPSLIEHILDIDLLQLEGAFLVGENRPSLLTFRAGRFAIADFSGLVLGDNVDGLEFGWKTSVANTVLTAGYTGLQLDRVSTISMTWADQNDGDRWAPPRLVASIQAAFPELILRQDLLASVLIQQDLRPQGNALNSQYFGLGIVGPILSTLYYDVFAYLCTGTTPGDAEDASILAALSGMTLRYFNEDLLNSRAELRFLFSSGDEDFTDLFIEGNTADKANVFVPISRQELALVFSPRLGNLMFVEASYSLKPNERLQTLVKGIVFLRPTTGPISDLRVDPFSENRYLGTEFDGVLYFRPFSDLGAALSLGIFVPMGGAFSDTYQKVEIQGQLEISFSF